MENSPSELKPRAKSSSGVYFVVLTIVLLLAIVAITSVLLFRPDKDNTQLITTIVMSIVPTVAAVIGVIKIQEVHLIMNSRLDQLVLAKESVAETKGRDGALAEALETKSREEAHAEALETKGREEALTEALETKK